MPMWNDGWGGWLAGFLMMLIVWGVLALLVVALVRGSRDDRRDRPSPGPDAKEILEERFARGEISEDEFRQRRRVLDEVS